MFKAIVLRLRLIVRSLLILFGVWFLIFANYGLFDFINLKKEQNILEAEITQILLQKEEMISLVRAISSEDIQIDLLEMQLRKVLAYGREGEIIFFWK